MKNYSNILWGILFIVVGVILSLNAFGLTEINVFFEGWWTLFIIVPSFIGLFNDDDKSGSIFGIVVGVLLLLTVRDVINFDLVWKLLFPLCLVLIGLSIIFKGLNPSKKRVLKLNKENENEEYYAIFSSQNVEIDSKKKFKGCDLTGIFGTVTCDLTNVNIKEDIIINTSSIFGKVEIKTSKDINVKVTSTPIFGGVNNKHKNSKANENTIYINSVCLFGSVDVK